MIMIKLAITLLVLVAVYFAAFLAAKLFATMSASLYWVLTATGIKKKDDGDLSTVEKPLFYLMEKSVHIAAKKESQIHTVMTDMYALDAEKAQKLDNMLSKVLPARKSA